MILIIGTFGIAGFGVDIVCDGFCWACVMLDFGIWVCGLLLICSVLCYLEGFGPGSSVAGV